MIFHAAVSVPAIRDSHVEPIAAGPDREAGRRSRASRLQLLRQVAQRTRAPRHVDTATSPAL